MYVFTRITAEFSHPLDVSTFQLSFVSELCQTVVPTVQEPNFLLRNHRSGFGSRMGDLIEKLVRVRENSATSPQP